MEIWQMILTFIGGGSFLAFLEFLIKRHDDKNDKMAEVNEAIQSLSKDMKERFDTLDKKIDTVKAKADEYNAVSCRVRILRFEDELQVKQKHSKDSWDQVMSDIDSYETYTKQHPDFRNNQTVATVTHIKHGYNERLEKRDWSY
jgi:hypothetical protein